MYFVHARFKLVMEIGEQQGDKQLWNGLRSSRIWRPSEKRRKPWRWISWELEVWVRLLLPVRWRKLTDSSPISSRSCGTHIGHATLQVPFRSMAFALRSTSISSLLGYQEAFIPFFWLTPLWCEIIRISHQSNVVCDLGYNTDDFPNTEVLYQFHTTEEDITHFVVSLLPSDNSKAYKWIVPCHEVVDNCSEIGMN